MTQLHRSAATVSVLALALGCGGGEPTGPGQPSPLRISLINGSGQFGPAGSELATPVTVQVRDGAKTVEGVTVAFKPATGSGTASPAAIKTDRSGAQFRWTLAATLGQQRATISAPGAPDLEVVATATVGPPVAMDTLAPSFQYAVVGRPVPIRPGVRVVDRLGFGVQGVAIGFVLSQEGSISASSVVTDADGVAAVDWTLNRSPGAQFLRASRGSVEVATFLAYGTPAVLAPVTPTQLTVNLGTAVSPTPAVRALDADGLPLGGVPVRFTGVTPAGTLAGDSVVTMADGTAALGSWVVGSAPGSYAVDATSRGVAQATRFQATAVTGIPAQIVAVAPPSQSGFFGNFVSVPPAVRVLDAAGRAIGGGAVVYQLIGGGGTLTGAAAPLGPDGLAAVGSWRLGSGGPQTVRATVNGLAPMDFVVEAAAPPVSDYHIELRLAEGVVVPGWDSAFDRARARWERLVVRRQSAVPIQLTADPGGCFPALDEMIDGLVVFLHLIKIDGPGGILGAAGACLAREETLIPAVGILLLDREDLVQLQSEHLLDDVVTHELAHIMGFSATLFRLKGLIVDDAYDPAFLGASASGVLGWLTPGGANPRRVALESQGGDGTRLSHWRESVFGTELMTGYADPVNQLSALTVAAMRDLGYVVDDTGADPYTLTSLLASVGPRVGVGPHVEAWRGPLRTVDARGRVRRIVLPR